MKTMLSEVPGVKIVAEAVDLNRGYEMVRQHKPSIVILDLSPTVDKALEMAGKISQNMPRTTLFVTSANSNSDMILKAMRAGAREFLSKPLNKEDVTGAVRGVIRLKNSRLMEKDNLGKVVTVFGVKGGVGTTTIATNLAVSLSDHAKNGIVLVDLNLQLGNAALFIDMQSRHSICEIADNIDDLNPKLLKSVLPEHSSGIHMLSSSAKIEEADCIKAKHLDRILTLLRSTFEYIVIDIQNILDEVTLKVLDESDLIFTVSTVDLPAVYNARQCLDVFQRMGYSQEKVRLVFNRYASVKELAFKEIEKSLEYPVYWKIPNQDYCTVVKSINEGVPLSIMKPNSKLGQSFKSLADQFNGNGNVDSGSKRKALKNKLLKKLFTKK
jgi:pilus assembly protein CpaE